MIENRSIDLFFYDIIFIDIGRRLIMDWKQVLINLTVMGGVYLLGYFSSYFFSRRYAEKKEREKNEKK